MTAPRVSSEQPTSSPTRSAASPTYFGNEGRRLFGWYHPAAAPRCAVVICSAVGDESTGWHRAARHWAETLAHAGVAVLRFDYDGTGDSFGALEDAGRVRAWIDSIGDAIDFARATSGAATLVVAGVRLGATLALTAAAERDDVDGLMLWAPYASGRAYLREGRAFTRLMAPSVEREDADTVPSVEQLGGLALTVETVRDLELLDPLATGQVTGLPTLVIPREEGTNDAALRDRLAKAGALVERRVLGGYASVITDAHQGQIPHDLIAGSLAWLGEHFPAGASDGVAAGARGTMAETSALRPTTTATRLDGVSERTVHMGADGTLFGIVSMPPSATRRRTGVLLVNSGAVYRVGPNRLHVSLARRWAALGYTVLRMDLGGLGDSPAPAHAEENRPYPPHAVRDVAIAVATLRAEGVERVVVGGLCSGAHTTFHAALSLEGIDGVMMVNPIVFYYKPSDPLDIGAWSVYVESRHYKQSARRWSSWRKMLRGQVNLFYVGKVALSRTSRIVLAKTVALTRRLGGATDHGESAPHDLGRIAAAGTDVLLMFSKGDPGHDFLTLHYANELAALQRLANFRLQIIRDADHTFTTLDARQRASAALTDHLLAHHP